MPFLQDDELNQLDDEFSLFEEADGTLSEEELDANDDNDGINMKEASRGDCVLDGMEHIGTNMSTTGKHSSELLKSK